MLCVVLSVLLLIWSSLPHGGGALLVRWFVSGGWTLAGLPLELWLMLLAPYIIVQALRAFRWSRTGSVQRQWANLYFFLLLLAIGGRSLYVAGDLLFFMYSLGDLPEELMQFIELEGFNLVIGILSFLLAGYCFKIVLDPRPKTGQRPGQTPAFQRRTYELEKGKTG